LIQTQDVVSPGVDQQPVVQIQQQATQVMDQGQQVTIQSLAQSEEDPKQQSGGDDGKKENKKPIDQLEKD